MRCCGARRVEPTAGAPRLRRGQGRGALGLGWAKGGSLADGSRPASATPSSSHALARCAGSEAVHTQPLYPRCTGSRRVRRCNLHIDPALGGAGGGCSPVCSLRNANVPRSRINAAGLPRLARARRLRLQCSHRKLSHPFHRVSLECITSLRWIARPGLDFVEKERGERVVAGYLGEDRAGRAEGAVTPPARHSPARSSPKLRFKPDQLPTKR